MEITITQVEARIPVTLIKPVGSIDGANFKQLIAAAEEAYEDGARAFLLDLEAVDYMSTAGLIALQSIAKLTRGEGRTDTDAGWGAIAEVDRDRDSGMQPNLRLLNPTERVYRSLEIVGFKEYFYIYRDADEALAAF